jgi:tripartite-type tricarboxylate transporter receptor subunit TctC
MIDEWPAGRTMRRKPSTEEDAMEVQRRRFLQLAASAAALPAVWHIAGAQAYPTRPVRLLVGFAPGGPNDIVARLVGERLSAIWGKPVVIDNVTGASGNLAADRVAKSAPDGHTLLMASAGQIVVNLSLYQKMTFDPTKDLSPISQLSSSANILAVHNDVPAKTVQDLVALARSQPGELTFASGGVGTGNHLAGELFKSMARIDIRHVPYRSLALAVPDLLAGRVSMAFLSASIIFSSVRL